MKYSPFSRLLAGATLAATLLLTPAMAEPPAPVPNSSASQDGTSVKVTGIRQSDGKTAVDVVAINSVPHAVNLNYAKKSGTRLKDDTGKTLALVAPEDNKALAVKAGETVKTTIFFVGTPAAGAKSLTLEINKDIPPAASKEHPPIEIANLSMDGAPAEPAK